MNIPVPDYRAARADFRRGSRSFAAAALLFDRATRRDVALLYAWCRHCDDVIDDQQLGLNGGSAPDQHDPVTCLMELEHKTRAAFSAAPCHEPIFTGLQLVARRHGIPLQLALDHLAGFRMDVEGRRYQTIADTLNYCHHVAGVVGLMMCRVMGVDDLATLSRACDLGVAFQLTNISRDVIEDAGRGRIYVPESWLHEAGLDSSSIADAARRPALALIAARLHACAEDFYLSATIGVGALPLRAAWAVATAHVVYRRIGEQVVRRGPLAWDRRVHTGTAIKLALMLRAGLFVCGTRIVPGSAVRRARPLPLSGVH